MRIGLITPEFPPMLGGMAELARGLAGGLAAAATVRVHSLPGTGDVQGDWLTGGDVTGRAWVDAPRLEEHDHGGEGGVDCWLLMNAGLVPLAQRLERPAFAYFHGNDFINPWLACGPRWLEAMRRPYAAGLRHALRRRQLRAGLPAIRHFMTNSRQTARLIEERLGVARSKIDVVHPGVADAFFQDQEPADSSESLRLLTVTRLSSHTRRKNVDGVMQAVALLEGRVDIRYTVVGDGDDRPRLEELARSLGIADRVEFAGSVDLDRLLEAYRRADLFVLASKATQRDVEGFGIVYLEACASGVPVLGSRAGGATDAVEPGRNGLLLEDSSPEAVAAGIEEFLSRRGELPAEKVRAFAEQFRWPKIAGQLHGVLKRHLPAAGPGATGAGQSDGEAR